MSTCSSVSSSVFSRTTVNSRRSPAASLLSGAAGRSAGGTGVGDALGFGSRTSGSLSSQPPGSSGGNERQSNSQQSGFLPGLQNGGGDSRDSQREKPRRTNYARNKNAPSDITVMGVVDQVYHHPPPELEAVEQTGSPVAPEKLRTINKARQWGGKAAPVKLHHRELDDEDEDVNPEGDDGPILPPRDMIAEIVANGKLENKLQKLQDDLKYSDFTIRNKEQQLRVLKEMKQMKQRKKHLHVPMDHIPVMKQPLLGTPPATAGGGGGGGSGKSGKKGSSTKQPTVTVNRDANKLTAARLPGHFSSNVDSYVDGPMHKKSFPEKRTMQTPLCTEAEDQKLPRRVLQPTNVTGGGAVLSRYVAQEVAADDDLDHGKRMSKLSKDSIKSQKYKTSINLVNEIESRRRTTTTTTGSPAAAPEPQG